MSDHSPAGPIWDWSTGMGGIVLLQSRRMYIQHGPPGETYAEVAAFK